MTWSANTRKQTESTIRSFRTLSEEDVIAAVLLHLSHCGDETIRFCRERGLFAYYSEWPGTATLFQAVLDSETAEGLSERALQYLRQKQACSWMGDFYRNTDIEIDRKLQQHYSERICQKVNGVIVETNIVLELMAFLDLYFRLSEPGRERQGLGGDINLDDFNSYSKEDISEAVSALIAKAVTAYPVSPGSMLWLDADYVLSDEIESLILLMLKRKALQEWEVSIDYFDYDMTEVDDDTFDISDKTNLELSLRVGYLKREFQEQAQYFYMASQGDVSASLQGLAGLIENAKEKVFIPVGEDPLLERYQMQIPHPLLELMAPKDPKHPRFFTEEFMELQYEAHELMLSFPKMLQNKVYKDCTLYDVVLFSRFFALCTMAQNLFIGEEGTDLKRFVRSITPVFHEKELLPVLSLFVGEKAKDLIDFFSWHPGQGKLDLQYTPIIKISADRYYFVPDVLTVSNLIRNAIVLSRKEQHTETNGDGKDDPLTAFACEIFEERGDAFQVAANRQFRFQGREGETDLVVWSKEHLYLIECKNAILPTDAYEQRTTYDYLRKAEAQLDLSRAALREPTAGKQILQNWGIEPAEREIHTVILLGNRVFSAPNSFRHPVRYIYELYMVLTKGMIYSSFGTWRYWEAENFQESDLLRFLSDTEPLSMCMYQAMDPYHKTMTCGNRKVRFATYRLDADREMENRDRYFQRV